MPATSDNWPSEASSAPSTPSVSTSSPGEPQGPAGIKVEGASVQTPSIFDASFAEATAKTTRPDSYNDTVRLEVDSRSQSPNRLIHIHIGDSERHVQANPLSRQEEEDRRIRWAQEMMQAHPLSSARTYLLPGFEDEE
ncbi:hypothetical protein AAFC00_006725 [Neodothiora populina]